MQHSNVVNRALWYDIPACLRTTAHCYLSKLGPAYNPTKIFGGAGAAALPPFFLLFLSANPRAAQVSKCNSDRAGCQPQLPVFGEALLRKRPKAFSRRSDLGLTAASQVSICPELPVIDDCTLTGLSFERGLLKATRSSTDPQTADIVPQPAQMHPSAQDVRRRHERRCGPTDLLFVHPSSHINGALQ